MTKANSLSRWLAAAMAALMLLTFLPDLLSGGSDKEQGKRIRQDSQKA